MSFRYQKKKKKKFVILNYISPQFSTYTFVFSLSKPLTSHRLNVKTHVFKKELQEYVPTQIEDRLRIETIIYVELSVVDQDGSTVNSFDYARMPKRLFYTQPDKLMTNQELASKRVIDIGATLHCPSNEWHEEKEACARCARRMSTKLDQDENRVSEFGSRLRTQSYYP